MKKTFQPNPDQAASNQSRPGQLRRGDEIEVAIEALAFGGEGVAKVPIDAADGQKSKNLAVFVEDVVPGDQVKVVIAQKKNKFARAYVKELLKPSPLRIQPRCKHFGGSGEANNAMTQRKCGGCTWQFLAYEQQLKFKEKQVRDAFERIGNFENPKILPIIGMKDPWYYRNKMEFSFQVIPMEYRKPDEEGLNLGLHVKKRHYDVIELEECFLLAPYVGDFVAEARAFFRRLELACRSGGKLAVEVGTSCVLDAEKSFDPELKLQSLTIREGKNTGEIMLILSAENDPEEGKGIWLQEFKKLAVDFFEKIKRPLTSFSFLNIFNQKGQPKIFQEKLLHGKAVILEILKVGKQELTFEIAAQAFFQPNTFQAQTLYAETLAAANLHGTETVYDLYCGTGTIGLAAAAGAKQVYGIELNPSAVENARANALLNNVKNIGFYQGDVEKVLATLEHQPDVIMVDPPRNGLQPKAIEHLLKLNAPRIVYVSCNPSTLARDAQILVKNGYQLEQVQPVDMFPQTYHIENVAAFSKK